MKVGGASGECSRIAFLALVTRVQPGQKLHPALGNYSSNSQNHHAMFKLCNVSKQNCRKPSGKENKELYMEYHSETCSQKEYEI